jgi:hypothetical protein
MWGGSLNDAHPSPDFQVERKICLVSARNQVLVVQMCVQFLVLLDAPILAIVSASSYLRGLGSIVCSSSTPSCREHLLFGCETDWFRVFFTV